MKTLMMSVIMLFLCCLPASGLCGTNNVDLTGNGLNHLPPNNAITYGRQAENAANAERGRKAMEETDKALRKNQEELRKSWDYMNPGRSSENPYNKPTWGPVPLGQNSGETKGSANQKTAGPSSSPPAKNTAATNMHKSSNQKSLHSKPITGGAKKRSGKNGKSWQVSHQ